MPIKGRHRIHDIVFLSYVSYIKQPTLLPQGIESRRQLYQPVAERPDRIVLERNALSKAPTAGCKQCRH